MGSKRGAPAFFPAPHLWIRSVRATHRHSDHSGDHLPQRNVFSILFIGCFLKIIVHDVDLRVDACKTVIWLKWINLQITQLQLEMYDVGTCREASRLFPHITSVCLVGFVRYLNEAVDVEWAVQCLEPFVTSNEQLKTAMIRFPNCLDFDGKMSAAEGKMRLVRRQLLLRHPKIAQWSAKLKLRCEIV